MIAREIMEQNVITVTEETTIEEVARILIDHGISGVPVVDGENRLKGIISDGDLIYKDKKIHIPAAIQILDSIIFVESLKKFQEELRKITAYKVKDMMTREVISVEVDTPIEEIATLMIEKRINRVPVLEDGKLVGIITRQNILKSMIGNKGEM